MTPIATSNIAWRFNVAGVPMYVEEIRRPDDKGDRYSYTEKVETALPMTEHQCRAFCAYMRACDSVGFWSGK